jgi:hypothetical protein
VNPTPQAHILQNEVAAVPRKSADAQVDSRECMLRPMPVDVTAPKDVNDTDKLK